MCFLPLMLVIVVGLASSLDARPRLLNILRCNSVFILFMGAFFGSLVSTSNANGMTPTATNSQKLLVKNCNISNFQFPPNENFSHIILTPLEPLSTTHALTITFRVKMKKLTRFPRILSYSVDYQAVSLAVEIPGTGLIGRAADSHQELKNGTSAREAAPRQPAGYYIYIDGQPYGVKHPYQPLNIWTRVTMTWSLNKKEYAIYVNGNSIVGPKVDESLKHKQIPQHGTLFMGQSNRLVPNFRFSGRIIDLQIWDLAFTPDEVKALPAIPAKVIKDNRILDVPPTYGNILKNGSTCDAECKPGSYELPQKGNDYKIHCKLCPKGKFSVGIGSSSCTPCPPGKFNPTKGQTSCPLCPIGEAQENPGKQHCIKCADGKYCIKKGCLTCTPCGPELPPLDEPDKFRQCLDGKLAIIKDKAATNNRGIISNGDHILTNRHGITKNVKDIGKNSGVISSNGNKIATNNRGINSNGDNIGTNKNKISGNEREISDLRRNQIRCEQGNFECVGYERWHHQFDTQPEYGSYVQYSRSFNSKPQLILALKKLNTLEFFNIFEKPGTPRSGPTEIEQYLSTTGTVYQRSADNSGFQAWCHCSNTGTNMTVGGTWMACGT